MLGEPLEGTQKKKKQKHKGILCPYSLWAV